RQYMMHLTCTNMPAEKIDHAPDTIKSYGYDKFVKTEGGFACALDLVKHTREKYALTTLTMKACLLEFEFGPMKKKKRESLLGSTSDCLADEILGVSGLMGNMVIGYRVGK
ncbi:hypothetical protein GIB67_009863, partial [Kingdonia uniflora]